jgi:hypothetical protein
VPRYTLAYDSMEPDPDGEWVRYVDCGGVTGAPRPPWCARCGGDCRCEREPDIEPDIERAPCVESAAQSTGQAAANTWCGTCQSWRFDPYCGRDDCPGPQPAPADRLCGCGYPESLHINSIDGGAYCQLAEARAQRAAALDEVATLHGAMAAADARLRAAEARVWPDGTTWGCDAPDHLADEVATLRAERDEARADCKSFWKLRAGLAERQLETLRARVAQLEAALRTIHLTCAEITEFVRSALSEVPHGR